MIPLAEHTVPHRERLSKRKSSGMSAYQLIPAHAQGCIASPQQIIATKALRTHSPGTLKFFSSLAA